MQTDNPALDFSGHPPRGALAILRDQAPTMDTPVWRITGSRYSRNKGHTVTLTRQQDSRYYSPTTRTVSPEDVHWWTSPASEATPNGAPKSLPRRPADYRERFGNMEGGAA